MLTGAANARPMSCSSTSIEGLLLLPILTTLGFLLGFPLSLRLKLSLKNYLLLAFSTLLVKTFHLVLLVPFLASIGMSFRPNQASSGPSE